MYTSENEIRCLWHSGDFGCYEPIADPENKFLWENHRRNGTACKASGKSCMIGIDSLTKNKLAEKADVANFGAFGNFTSKNGKFCCESETKEEVPEIFAVYFMVFLA